MKIQLTATKTIEWTAPWEKATSSVSDIVGIELESGFEEGCPVVRLQRKKEEIALISVGFLKPPEGGLPTSWDDLRNQPRCSLPSAFKADHAALTVNSADAFTTQASAAMFTEGPNAIPEGVAMSKDGSRSVYRKMADESSVLQASLPEYQALWLNRLLPEGHRPTAISLQTVSCSLLSSLAAQPGFCENGDEAAVFVTRATVDIVGYRNGIPLLFRASQNSAGSAAMREAVKMALGIDESMIDTVFASNGIIDTKPALEPLLSPVVSQIEMSLDYLKNRMNSNIRRLFLMGHPAGCNALRRAMEGRITIPIVTPDVFDGLQLPAKSTAWKEQYCVGEMPQKFLAALGAALSVLRGES